MNHHSMAGIYCRLSREDGGSDSESNSIHNQRQMLRRYCKEQNFGVYAEYIDDGISGVTFARDGFRRMLADIEKGKISIVVCKDLSRLGRNNAMVAYYTEIVFPEAGVRFICVNDGIDSATGENEIMGFKSVINEYYARDISKKIKSSNRTRALAGEFSATYAPLGYAKSPQNKHRLVVEEKSAEIVRRIFKMAAKDGLGTWQIAERLNAENLPTPKHAAMWLPSSVRVIIQNRVYLGEVVNCKTHSKSFKSSKRHKTPTEQQIYVQNMHPPLVSNEDFELAQRIIKKRQRTNKSAQSNIFVGILHCADCASPMSFTPAVTVKAKDDSEVGARRDSNANTKHGLKSGGYFMCNRYRCRAKDKKRACSFHYLPMDYIMEAVLAALQAKAAEINVQELASYAKKLEATQATLRAKKADRELAKLKHRRSELEIIVRKLFEQNALGVITDEHFFSMQAAYSSEQSEMKERIATLQAEIQMKEDATPCNGEPPCQVAAVGGICLQNIINRYINTTALDAGILNELISRIDVHSAEGKRDKRRQLLEIHWRFRQ